MSAATSSKEGSVMKSGMNPAILAVGGVLIAVIAFGAGLFASRIPALRRILPGSNYAQVGAPAANGEFSMMRFATGGGQGKGNIQFATGRGDRMMGKGLMFAGGAIGEVTSTDDKSMTVKMPDGSSRIIITTDSTQYQTTTSTEKSAITTGKTVRVLGTPNSDGSLTAESVVITPNLASPQPTQN